LLEALRRTRVGGLALSLALLVPLAGACGDDPPASVLDPSDFQPPGDEEEEGLEPITFDKDDLVSAAELTDFETIEASAVQSFLTQSPYGKHKSFLVTYQSNGVRAADAVVDAARKYRINPLLLLAYAQATQGLVSAQRYPFPPERVEYVFRCGALTARDYDRALAGFDKQLACLARDLRGAIDEIQVNSVTAAGWGPDQVMVTLDDVKVTPVSAATAALYDHTPIVARGKAGGLWIVWNIWNRYKLALGYSGPLESADGKWVGEECQSVGQCSSLLGEGAICASAPQYPGGSCTVACAADQPCPSAPSKKEVFCAKYSRGAYCLPVCNRVAPDCRPGYECKAASGIGSGEAKDVCTPVPQ
jgi:hypothetical protein